MISPLIRGMASLVIHRSGTAVIGSWGHGLPRRGERVASVRQDLHLLVRRGQVSPAAADWGLWGATLGGGEYVARSALGQNAAGQLTYAGSMSASPAALAQALVHAGARNAMELDINPEWVQLDVARKGPGGWWRIAKNAARYLLRVQERPVPTQAWTAMLIRAGFAGVTSATIVAEAGLVTGQRPETS